MRLLHNIAKTEVIEKVISFFSKFAGKLKNNDTNKRQKTLTID